MPLTFFKPRLCFRKKFSPDRSPGTRAEFLRNSFR